jgi:head-tail adaptor
MSNIGKKKYRITLQKPNLVEDGRGGFKPAPETNGWQTVANVFADIELPHRLTSLMWQGQVTSEILHKFNIWRRDDVQVGWQILWNGQVFSVAHKYLFNQLEMVVVGKEVD